MRTYNPDYSWRIKLGGPEEEDPLSIPGKVGNHFDREQPLVPRMVVDEERADEIREMPLKESDYEGFRGTGEHIISRNSSSLSMPAFNFESGEEDGRNQMIHYIQVAPQATALSNDQRGSDEFNPHNVDIPSEHLSIAQISDMWLQFAENGSEALDQENWEDRKVQAFLEPDYARDLADKKVEDYDLGFIFSMFGDILKDEEDPERGVETYQGSYLPVQFSIAEVETGEEYLGETVTDVVAQSGDDTAYLSLNQDPEEILDSSYEGPISYSSRNIDTVNEHLGLAGMAEKWFDGGSVITEDR